MFHHVIKVDTSVKKILQFLNQIMLGFRIVDSSSYSCDLDVFIKYLGSQLWVRGLSACLHE